MFSVEKRIGRPAVSCAAALIGLLAAASPALAADAYLTPSVANYHAAPGESNRVTITGSGRPAPNDPLAGSTTTLIQISDTGTSNGQRINITPHSGCQATLTPDVTCELENDFIRVMLDDQNDFVDMQHTEPAIRTDLRAGVGADEVWAGLGNDHLFGEDGNDTLRGRGGADMLFGGPGTDTADYSDRRDGVRVTLPEPPLATPSISQPPWPAVAGNDGRPGEGDDIQADVENVWGGDGGDDLFGSSANNRISGIWGDDYVEGGAGGDTLLGRAGGDALRGGPGGDVIIARDGEKDWIDCGPGYDMVWADPFDYLGDFAVGRKRGALMVIENPSSGFLVEAGGGCEDLEPDFPSPPQ
jgi:Ca2+-binding RTX toxin-like protein